MIGKTAWEEYGIPIGEYGKCFNRILADAFDRAIGNNVYLVNTSGGELKVNKIRNIKLPTK